MVDFGGFVKLWTALPKVRLLYHPCADDETTDNSEKGMMQPSTLMHLLFLLEDAEAASVDNSWLRNQCGPDLAWAPQTWTTRQDQN